MATTSTFTTSSGSSYGTRCSSTTSGLTRCTDASSRRTPTTSRGTASDSDEHATAVSTFYTITVADTGHVSSFFSDPRRHISFDLPPDDMPPPSPLLQPVPIVIDDTDLSQASTLHDTL